MRELLLRIFSNASSLGVAGNDVLIIGLIGDLLVLFIPSTRRTLERVAAVFFVILIIAGVWMERVADDAAASPRLLSDEQLLQIKETVSPYAGQKFDVAPYLDDKEALALAKQIAMTLLNAGWLLDEPKPPPFTMGGNTGVIIVVSTKAPQKTKDAASRLVSALMAERIDAIKRENANGIPVAKLSMIVGKK